MAGVWDVVRVPFPYADRPVVQYRPALVVAVPEAGGGVALVWVLMITSAVNLPWQGDVAIADLATAGLPVASVIRTAKIATIDRRQVERIGSLPAAVRVSVRGLLRDRLGS